MMGKISATHNLDRSKRHDICLTMQIHITAFMYVEKRKQVNPEVGPVNCQAYMAIQTEKIIMQINADTKCKGK